jgi:hypothetical protein
MIGVVFRPCPAHMLRIPRFAREDVNPRFTAEADMGALFQQFVWEVFLRYFPALRNFAASGRDGAIDQSATPGDPSSTAHASKRSSTRSTPDICARRTTKTACAGSCGG